MDILQKLLTDRMNALEEDARTLKAIKVWVAEKRRALNASASPMLMYEKILSDHVNQLELILEYIADADEKQGS